jgi:carbonic anhydrase
LHVALDLEGEHLELVQINFHTPSDFIVEGMQVATLFAGGDVLQPLTFALQHAAEAHLVHVSSYDGSVVIVVALFDFGSHTPSGNPLLINCYSRFKIQYSPATGFAEALTMVLQLPPSIQPS